MDENTNVKKADYSVNWMVFWVLAILTAGEYYLGVAAEGKAGTFLLAFAVIKAGFIIANYMNIGRVFSRREEH